jgi:hypothetical protein
LQFDQRITFIILSLFFFFDLFSFRERTIDAEEQDFALLRIELGRIKLDWA